MLYVAGDSDNALNIIDLRTQLGLLVDPYMGVVTATPRSALEAASVVTAAGLNVEGAVMASGNGEFGNLAARGSVVVDSTGTNSGSQLPGLVFGGGGEGVSSKGTPGAGQNGLDFYTASQHRMHLSTNGNVGIGSVSPNHRLSLSRGPTWTANLWTGAVELEDAAALGWRANAAGQRFGIGHSGGGFYFFRTAGNPGTTANEAIYDVIISDAGNVGIGTALPLQRLHVIGNIFATGTMTPNSDRNAKTDVAEVDTAIVLARLADLPIKQWRFKPEAEGVRHYFRIRMAFSIGHMLIFVVQVPDLQRWANSVPRTLRHVYRASPIRSRMNPPAWFKRSRFSRKVR